MTITKERVAQIRAAAGGDSWIEELADALDELLPDPCVMTHTPPYDFAQCATHDTTFPLGGVCKYHGKSMGEIAAMFADEVDEQRLLKVRAEAERDSARFGEGEAHELINRQADLLTGVVNALRGDPPELVWHSHHDAPALAKAAAEVVRAADDLYALHRAGVAQERMMAALAAALQAYQEVLADAG